MREIKRCDCCGKEEFEFLFSGYDRMHDVTGEFKLVRCRNCGLIFINPQPLWEVLKKHYPKGYYSLKGEVLKKSFGRGISDFVYNAYFGERQNFFLKLLFFPARAYIRGTKIVRGGKILDAGCGSGSFLLKMKSFGMDCFGVEPGDFDKDFAKDNGLNIFHGTVEEAKFPDNFFDVIAVYHVFEHVPEPSETLAEFRRILKPNGILIMDIPQSNCLGFKIFKENWLGLDVPRHLYTFSESVIKRYAEKTGLRVRSVKHVTNSTQLLVSWLYFVNRLRKSKRFLAEYNANIIARIVLEPFAYLFNFFRQGDLIEVWLSKE